MPPASLAPAAPPTAEAPAQDPEAQDPGAQAPQGGPPLPMLSMLAPASNDLVDGLTMPGMETAAAPHLETEGLIGKDEPLDEPDVSALGVLPKEFKGGESGVDRTKLDDLAMRIAQAIQAGDDQRGRLPERWARNEAFSNNKQLAPTRLPYPGAPYFHVPFMGPRLDQRAATFVQTVLGARPHFRFRKLGSPEPATVVEDTIQFGFDAMDFEGFLIRYVESLMRKNAGIARVTFQMHEDGIEVGATHTGEFALPFPEYIDCESFCIYPANENGINAARFVGHSFDMMHSAVKERQTRGDWLPADLLSDATKKERQKARSGRESANDLQDASSHARTFDDENVELFAGVWKGDEDGDGIEERYEVIIVRNPDTVLRLERMETPHTGYHHSEIKHEDGTFWTESSPAQDLQGLQVVMNTTVNQTFWGADYASRPAVMMEGGDVKGAKGYRPGEWKTVGNLQKAMPIPSEFRGDFYMPLIELLRQTGDTASRTSDAITGAPSNGSEATATEQSIKLQGFQTGVSDDISRATKGLVSIAVDMWRLMIKHFDDIKPIYGDALAAKTAADLEGKYTVELNGRSPADSPQAVAMQAQNLISLIAQAKDLIPGVAMILLAMIKTIISASNLPNKHDIVSAIDQAIAAEQQMAAQAQAQGAATGQPPTPGQPPVPNAGAPAGQNPPAPPVPAQHGTGQGVDPAVGPDQMLAMLARMMQPQGQGVPPA